MRGCVGKYLHISNAASTTLPPQERRSPSGNTRPLGPHTPHKNNSNANPLLTLLPVFLLIFYFYCILTTDDTRRKKAGAPPLRPSETSLLRLLIMGPIYMYTHEHTQTHIYVCIYMTYTHTHTHTHTRTHTHTHMNMCVCVCVCTCTYMHVCMYVCM